MPAFLATEPLACLWQPTEDTSKGVIRLIFHVDGRGLEHLVMWGGGSAEPTTTQETLDAGKHFLFQDGRNVYKNAVTDMYTASVDILNRNNLTAETIGWLVLDQANLRIIEAVSSRAGIPGRKGAGQHPAYRQHIGSLHPSSRRIQE